MIELQLKHNAVELVSVTHISLAQFIIVFKVCFFFQLEKLNAVGWRPIFLLEYPKKEAKMLLPEGRNSSVGERECIDNIKKMYTLMVEGEHLLYIITSLYNPNSEKCGTQKLNDIK